MENKNAAIWVEVLARHHEVAVRHRCAGDEVHIGRGYDNDVVIDDPYIAVNHLRIVRDESGALVAVDLGSAGGLFTEHGRVRQERIAIDGDHPIRIGRSLLRIREARHAVAPERVVQAHDHPWLMALALGAAILTLELIGLWLGETGEPKLLRYASTLLGVTLVVLAWATGWSILSRIFSGQAHFERNLLFALTGLLAFSLYDEFAEYSAFALSWRALASYEYIAMWLFIAILCFYHLRSLGPSRLKLKGGVVAALALIAIGMQTLTQSDAGAAYDRQNYVRRLKPPALRLVSPQSEQAFFSDVAQLKGKLDRARTEEPVSGSFSSLADTDD